MKNVMIYTNAGPATQFKIEGAEKNLLRNFFIAYMRRERLLGLLGEMKYAEGLTIRNKLFMIK